MCSHKSPFALHRTFPAQMNVLPGALDFVAGACFRLGLRDDTVLRAKLVIEELFTNSVLHGYRGAAGMIWLTAYNENAHVCIGYQDAAPAYNPFDENAVSARLMHAKADQYTVGGLGIILVSHLADSVSYRYENGRNILGLNFFDRK